VSYPFNNNTIGRLYTQQGRFWKRTSVSKRVDQFAVSFYLRLNEVFLESNVLASYFINRK